MMMEHGKSKISRPGAFHKSKFFSNLSFGTLWAHFGSLLSIQDEDQNVNPDTENDNSQTKFNSIPLMVFVKNFLKDEKFG